MPTLVINGREVRAAAGQTILEAARSYGIFIPTLCDDPTLTPFGGCRMCLVEVAGARGPVASCTMPVADGMVVETHTERVEMLRRGVLELLLSNHPNDCLLCEKTGSCGLQDMAYRYGVNFNTYRGQTRVKQEDDPNPFIARDNEKCILCGKCVRACAEVTGAAAIDFAGRGFTAKISTGTSSLLDSPCEFCGKCVSVCPTGALGEKKRAGLGRSFQMEKVVKTTCGYCGTGCSLYLEVAGGRIVGSVPDPFSPVNKGQL
jgi:formate dehydrogenase alpha subunit